MARGLPAEVAHALVAVVGRADFACLEWDRHERRWWAGLFNGRFHADGRPKITQYGGERLGLVLDHVRTLPVTALQSAPARQTTLLPAGDPTVEGPPGESTAARGGAVALANRLSGKG